MGEREYCSVLDIVSHCVVAICNASPHDAVYPMLCRVQDLSRTMYEWPARGRAPPPAAAVPGTLEDQSGLFPQQFHRFPEIVVVVTYKQPAPIGRVRLLEEMYRSVFGKVQRSLPYLLYNLPAHARTSLSLARYLTYRPQQPMYK